MPTILLTGCAGFIGSHTAERLLKEGYTVVGLDNFSRFYDRSVKESNLAHFADHANFRFVEQDIRDLDGLLKSIPESIDRVIHLAAKAGVRPSIQDPGAYIDTNLHGTRNILELMRQRGARKMVFASSSSVYGNQKSIPFLEDELEDKPISPYAFTKRAAELMNYTYHHLYGIDSINARLFTVYGPRQRPDLAIHKFVKLIANGEPIQMFGDGSTARDYTFVEDTVEGLMRCLHYLEANDQVFEILNLGNNHPVKLTELISGIETALGIKANIQQKPMQEGDVDITYANIDRATKLVGYQPTIQIEAGLVRFVEWYRNKS